MILDNQVAVVTGGASGIGQACVRALSARGIRVIVWDLQVTGLHDAIACDVSNEADVEKAMAQTISMASTPRICINCAGIAPAKRIVGKEGAMPLSDFQKVININLVGTFNVLRVVAEAMTKLEAIDDERGVIINTASIAAYEGQIGQAAYAASKGGVVALTMPAARELARFGVRVNAIAPGLIATPLLLNMPKEVQDSLAQGVPFPKRFGKPEEVAKLVIHIIENTMINGEVIRIDGALRMQP